MKFSLLILATCMIAGTANATMVVDGIAGGDTDGTSPFETLQAALDAAITNSDPLVEIATDAPIPGAWVGTSTSLPMDMTIQAGEGFTPKLTTNLMLVPGNGATRQITLNNLTINTESPQVDYPGTINGSGRMTPLMVGCNLVANDCKFGDAYTGPVNDLYAYGVSAGLDSPDTVSSMTLNRCIIRGHNGLAAGRSVKDYTLNDCLVEGLPTTLEPFWSGGIVNQMNWAHDYAMRFSAPDYTEVEEPRTLNLNRCVVRGGYPLGWPGGTLSDTYYANENNIIGPVTAVNTVFVGIDRDAGGLNAYQFAFSASSSRLGQNVMAPNQHPSGTFIHCTFASNNQSWGGDPADGFSGDPFVTPHRLMGGIRIESKDADASTVNFSNCLFDLPRADFAVGVNKDAHTTAVSVMGDGNVYRILENRAYVDLSNAPDSSGGYLGPDNQTDSLENFETTTVFEVNTSFQDLLLTDNLGNLIEESLLAQATERAVVLVPPVLVDKDNDLRPQPALSLKADVGADEIGDSSSLVRDWAIY